ncbi:MAG: hypothetical protein EOO89_28885, partial [Pedobacter sp.]
YIITVHQERINDISWIDENVLATCSKDNMITISDLRMSSIISVFHGHSSQVSSVVWSKDQRMLASAGDDHKVYLWSLRKPLPELTLNHEGPVKSLEWSGTYRNILYSGEKSDATIRAWDVSTCIMSGITLTYSNIIGIYCLPDKKHILSAHSYPYPELNIWKNDTLSLIHTFNDVIETSEDKAPILYSTISPSGEILVTACLDETVRMWKLPCTSKKENEDKLSLAYLR